MPAPLSAPGVGLQVPQNLYPSELYNAPYDSPTNEICLNAGDELVIPAGTWYVTTGMYSFLEWLDPVTQVWTMAAAGCWNSGPYYVKSDGFNFRVANRTGCPVGASITNAGSAYVQASTTISVTGGGGSTWQPIIGGALAVVGGTLTSNGAGYGVAPILLIPAPPPANTNPNGVGGIQASGYCVISSGTVSGVTLTNQGAGYPVAPTAVIVPNPTDPNIATGITAATVAFSLTGSGSLVGVLCTNPGAPLSNPSNITLTVSGVGTNASVVPAMLQTVTAASVVGGSTITGASVAAMVTTAAGGWSLGSIATTPEFLGLKARPRPANISLAVGGNGTIAAQTGTIIDGGLFFSPPAAILNSLSLLTAGVPGSIIGSSTLTLTMGSRQDLIKITSAP